MNCYFCKLELGINNSCTDFCKICNAQYYSNNDIVYAVSIGGKFNGNLYSIVYSPIYDNTKIYLSTSSEKIIILKGMPITPFNIQQKLKTIITFV